MTPLKGHPRQAGFAFQHKIAQLLAGGVPVTRTVAILTTDMVGATAQIIARETRQAAEYIAAHYRLLQAGIDAH